MDLNIQPTLDVEVKPVDKGIVSRKEYFREKEFEKIRKYFFAGHLLRHWKPKAELIYPSVTDESSIQYEYDFNRDVQNCFNEDFAEEVYLRTPPPCFVVIGKFGSNLTELSAKIAKEYGSVLIQVDNIIGQVIKANTRSGVFLDRVLRLGVSITLNFVLAVLSYYAHTPEARHRGYVLCGLPVSPYLHDLPVEQQLCYPFTWENKPTVVVNVLYEDEDLVRERRNWRWKLHKTRDEFFLSHDDLSEEEEEEKEEKEEKEGEEEEEEEEEDVEEEQQDYFTEERDLEDRPSRQRLWLPRDEEDKVWSELEAFDIKIKATIDMLKTRLDPQYFITVDSRIDNGFEIVQARLKLLQVWKVPVPFPLVPQKQKTRILEKKLYFSESEEEEGEHDEEVNDEMMEIVRAISESPQRAFLTLFTKKTISPKYRWELSHYNYTCPVSLRDGLMVEGKSEFAVVFLKYIFFLRDKESMAKFLKNPRPYVLPVRPKPRFRFIIIGYPYCLKTSLAKFLSTEFSISVIDFNTILKTDLLRKKYIYREFCRQKAEAREVTKLTAQAWQNWRKEEEQRIALIEKWISYIQSLLNQRIEQFYTTEPADNASDKETQVQSYSPLDSEDDSTPESGEGEGKTLVEEKLLEVRGVSIDPDPYDRERTPVQSHTSPSEKIIRAMKHDDYEFNEHGLEVEANLFFSSLWNTFTKEHKRSVAEKTANAEERSGKKRGEEEVGEAEDVAPVNWCNLLPPQSLSSFLLKKKPYTVRESRKSFRMLLEAASKAYWSPSDLLNEFVKWKLPCYMDIPLCEIFLDNPFLLFKYCPEWLKERPPFPEPVDVSCPSVIEAGYRSFAKAGLVTIHHEQEEREKLLSHALEKAEKDGMKLTVGVPSPGGWVVDNMDLDVRTWRALADQNLLPDYVYVVTDSELEFRRIIDYRCSLTHWLDEDAGRSSEQRSPPPESKKEPETSDEDLQNTLFSDTAEVKPYEENDVMFILKKTAEYIKQGTKHLDGIFHALIHGYNPTIVCVPMNSLDPFCHYAVVEMVEPLHDDEIENAVSRCRATNQNFAIARDSFYSENLPLGEELQHLTDEVLSVFGPKVIKKDSAPKIQSSDSDEIRFYLDLLMLPRKLQQIRDFLSSINKSDIVKEIDVRDKAEADIYEDVRKNLNADFLKKPRELESFEVRELERDWRREQGGEEMLEENDTETETEEEDLRIWGESGPFCIVSLYNNVLLLGKPEFALRYYGKLFLFWNQNAKDEFIKNPEKYAPYYSPIRCLPPLRIFVTGGLGCGKSTLSRSVASQCSAFHLDYIPFLNFKLVPHMKPGYSKLTALDSKKLLLSEGFNAEAVQAKSNFMKVPYVKRMFYLENPFNAEDEKYVLENTINRDPLPTTFPEFTYRCIESIEEDEEEKEEEEEEDEEEEKEYDDFEEEEEEGALRSKRKSRKATRSTATSNSQPYKSMKEVEFMLAEYLQNKADIGEYCMEKTLRLLWNKTPFNTGGFVLDGFPLRNFDVQHILSNSWFPDAVIEVLLPENVALERNMKKILEQWETKLKQEIVEEKLLEDTLTIIQKILMSIRRDQLNGKFPTASVQRVHPQKSSEFKNEDLSTSRDYGKQKLRKRLSSKSEKFSVLESAKSTEVEDTLIKEFPPLEFNPIFETYDSGRARLTEDFILNYRRDVEEIKKLKPVFLDLKIPWLEVDGTKDHETNLVNLFIKLNKLINRGNKRGEFAFPIKMETAEKLLQQGYYFLSKFGRWCPVQMFRSKNPIHMFRPLHERGKVIPVAYRNYIYFVGGENEKNNFIKDPVKFTFHEPRLPSIPLRLAVIGPPKSGKSFLSHRLGAMFGLKVVTMGSALRFVLAEMGGSALQKSITRCLRRGCFLPLSLKMQALIASLSDPACATQGFVIDGIPFDAAVTQGLAEEGKLPFVILSLVADAHFGKTNREKLDREKFRLPYKHRVDLDSKYKDWDETYKRFVQWNQDTYSNLYELDAKLNPITTFYEAYDIIKKSYFGILYYVENCVTDQALPLEYLCVSQHEYELRKSSFHNNCPVCWVELTRLNCVSDPPPRSGLIQYLDRFYWVCPKHFESFLKTPKKYLPPRAKEFPKVLPKVLNRCMFETASLKIHGLERCPVTRTDMPDSLEWMGSWDFAVSYDDKVYLCRNREMMQRFLAQPWKYCFADTEFETGYMIKSTAVEDLGPPKLANLPPIGFLEQTVADLIHKGLQILGSVRPLHPNMTPTCTGCTFLGLYLKVYNKNNPGLLEQEYLKFMMHSCQAYRYRAMPFKRSTEDENDFEPEPSESNESDYSSKAPLETSDSSMDSFWLDFETQADKIIWSAKNLSAKYFRMKIDSNDELKDIVEVPTLNVVLNFRSCALRAPPLPPISNCICFIYSCKPSIRLPDKFNINSLYQPKLYSSRFARLINSKTEKQNLTELFQVPINRFQSDTNLWQGKRAISEVTVSYDEVKSTDEMDPNDTFMANNFIPRFQILDVMPAIKIPGVPKVVENEPLFFDPHYDYSYVMLLAEFFQLSHVIRCFEWSNINYHLEYTSLLDRNLGLCTAPSRHIFTPKISRSVHSWKSSESVKEIFDSSRWMYPREDSDPRKGTLRDLSHVSPSIIHFIHSIISDHVEDIFTRLSSSALSYDSYETQVVMAESEGSFKPMILVREILPYPPLYWDIISRPYFAFNSVRAIFEVPKLDNIAHERHVSLLDGIMEPNDQLRFVRYPTWVQEKLPVDDSFASKSKIFSSLTACGIKRTVYPVYDFFNLEWSSFLVCNFSWVINNIRCQQSEEPCPEITKNGKDSGDASLATR